MTNTIHSRKFTSHWLAIGLFISSQTLAATGVDNPVVATIEGEPIKLSDVDDSGGRHLYDKAQELYQARVQSLYALLSKRLMTLEAESRNVTLEYLQQKEVTDKVAPISDAAIEHFIAQQPNMDGSDPRVQRRVSLFLRMQAGADQKSHFMQTLFDKYGVHVTLTAPPAPPPEEIIGDIAPALGPPTAPVKIVSFSDYQCIHCRNMSTTLRQLHQRFPDAVQIVYRHFPLQAGSQQLAEAALCAEDQDRFWDYHAALFAAQKSASDQTQSIAEQLGLDRETFATCLSQQRHRSRVLQDIREGERLQITGTPTNFVNGIRIHGAAKLPTLVAQVEKLLMAEPRPAAVATSGPHGAVGNN